MRTVTPTSTSPEQSFGLWNGKRRRFDERRLLLGRGRAAVTGSIGAEAAVPIRLNDLGGSRFHLHEDFARLSHAPIDVSVRVLPVRRISVEPGAQLSRHRGTKDHQRQTRNRQAEPNPLQAISFLPTSVRRDCARRPACRLVIPLTGLMACSRGDRNYRFVALTALLNRRAVPRCRGRRKQPFLHLCPRLANVKAGGSRQ